MNEIKKNKKVYCIYFQQDNIDPPYRWVTEKNPFYVVATKDGECLISDRPPYDEETDTFWTFARLINSGKLSSEPKKVLFPNYKKAMKTCDRLNKEKVIPEDSNDAVFYYFKDHGGNKHENE